MDNDKLAKFYKDKKVLVTGHTGFKGAWMCQLLTILGADVTGYALKAPTTPSVFELCNVESKINSVIGDIRDLNKLMTVFQDTNPQIVIHMAAQPIVRESYKDPVGTYETNVLGTVNVLECVRKTDSVKSFINVTTDKVYRNEERPEGYREDEYLDGYDPYSNSKSCSELVTSSYKKSFFAIPDSFDGDVDSINEKGMRICAISTCRAGNVIGGGDFATDRIIPDCVQAAMEGKNIVVRNPHSIRPYQHVLEPVYMYLWLAMKQWEEPSIQGAYNIGPNDEDCVTTANVVDKFCENWTRISGKEISWDNLWDGGPHEATFLKLDSTKIKNTLGWKPRWSFDETIKLLVEWYYAWSNGKNVSRVTTGQIEYFLNQ